MRGVIVLAIIVTGTVVRGEGPDFSRQHLIGRDFPGQNLHGANFQGAELFMVEFQGADLRGANFAGAKIQRIDVSDADLRGATGWDTADFGDGITAHGANFSGCNFRGVTITGTYFEKADFSGADFTNATLDGRFQDAIFDEAIVKDALMIGAAVNESLHKSLRQRGAIVTKDDFVAAVRKGREFHQAHLRGVQLDGVDLKGVRLSGADLHSARFEDSRLYGADLQGAEFYWGQAKRANFEGANLSGAVFDNVTAEGANFEGCRLTKTSFQNARLSGASFRHCDLAGADFSFADLTGADLTGAQWNDAILDGAIVDDVRGVSEEDALSARSRAGRWKYDVILGLCSFLTTWSLPLHATLTPLTVLLSVVGYRQQRRRSFFWLAGINCVWIMPLLLGLAFRLTGGSPVAQLSPSGLWSMWFSLWTLMFFGVPALLLITLVICGVHVGWSFRNASLRKLAVSFACVLFTLANSLLAVCVLGLSAPDA